MKLLYFWKLICNQKLVALQYGSPGHGDPSPPCYATALVKTNYFFTKLPWRLRIRFFTKVRLFILNLLCHRRQLHAQGKWFHWWLYNNVNISHSRSIELQWFLIYFAAEVNSIHARTCSVTCCSQLDSNRQLVKSVSSQRQLLTCFVCEVV